MVRRYVFDNDEVGLHVIYKNKNKKSMFKRFEIGQHGDSYESVFSRIDPVTNSKNLTMSWFLRDRRLKN